MRIGINCTEAALLTSLDRQAIFKEMRSVGVTTVRCEIPIKGVTWNPGYADALVIDALNAGLELVAMVAHPPTGYTPAQFGVTMAALAKRYPAVVNWQIWNEQNAERFFPKGNPEAFLPYLQAAYTAIKANNPASRVILGGLASCASASRLWYQFWLPPYTNVGQAEWLERLLKAGGRGYFDVVALHCYSWDAGFRWHSFDPNLPFIGPGLDGVRTVLARYALTTPLWVTEYGFVLNHFTPEEMQINAAAETAYLANRALVDRAYLYTWRDSDAAYGLMDKANVHRPGYDWFKSLAK